MYFSQLTENFGEIAAAAMQGSGFASRPRSLHPSLGCQKIETDSSSIVFY